MGINGLLQQLKSISRPTHVSSYRGQKVAIDGYSWLHKGAYGCSRELCEGIWADGYVRYFVSRIDMLLGNGVIPIVVFDGCRLPMKADEEDSRRRNRREALERARAHAEAGNAGAATECYQRAVDIAPWMAKVVMEALRERDVTCLVAPYEADAQMSYLALRRDVYAVLTEDSDMLAYGCPRVLYKLDRSGTGEEVQLQDLPLVRELNMAGFDHDMLLQMCILAGCDFLPNLTGVGIKRAHAMIRKHRDFVKVIRFLRFNGTSPPPGYEVRFQRTVWLFRHQRVYCPDAKALTHLRPLPPGGLGAADVLVLAALPTEGPERETLPFLGPPMNAEVAAGIATGFLDPSTLQPFDLPAIYRGCAYPPRHLRALLLPPAPAVATTMQHRPHGSFHDTGLSSGAGGAVGVGGSGTRRRHSWSGAAVASGASQSELHGSSHHNRQHHNHHQLISQQQQQPGHNHGRHPAAGKPPVPPNGRIDRYFFASNPAASQPFRSHALRAEPPGLNQRDAKLAGSHPSNSTGGGGGGGGGGSQVVTLGGLPVETVEPAAIAAVAVAATANCLGKGDQGETEEQRLQRHVAAGQEGEEENVGEGTDCLPPSAKRRRLGRSCPPVGRGASGATTGSLFTRLRLRTAASGGATGGHGSLTIGAQTMELPSKPQSQPQSKSQGSEDEPFGGAHDPPVNELCGVAAAVAGAKSLAAAGHGALSLRCGSQLSARNGGGCSGEEVLGGLLGSAPDSQRTGLSSQGRARGGWFGAESNPLCLDGNLPSGTGTYDDSQCDSQYDSQFTISGCEASTFAAAWQRGGGGSGSGVGLLRGMMSRAPARLAMEALLMEPSGGSAPPSQMGAMCTGGGGGYDVGPAINASLGHGRGRQVRGALEALQSLRQGVGGSQQPNAVSGMGPPEAFRTASQNDSFGLGGDGGGDKAEPGGLGQGEHRPLPAASAPLARVIPFPRLLSKPPPQFSIYDLDDEDLNHAVRDQELVPVSERSALACTGRATRLPSGLPSQCSDGALPRSPSAQPPLLRSPCVDRHACGSGGSTPLAPDSDDDEAEVTSPFKLPQPCLPRSRSELQLRQPQLQQQISPPACDSAVVRPTSGALLHPSARRRLSQGSGLLQFRATRLHGGGAACLDHVARSPKAVVMVAAPELRAARSAEAGKERRGRSLAPGDLTVGLGLGAVEDLDRQQLLAELRAEEQLAKGAVGGAGKRVGSPGGGREGGEYAISCTMRRWKQQQLLDLHCQDMEVETDADMGPRRNGTAVLRDSGDGNGDGSDAYLHRLEGRVGADVGIGGDGSALGNYLDKGSNGDCDNPDPGGAKFTRALERSQAFDLVGTVRALEFSSRRKADCDFGISDNVHQATGINTGVAAVAPTVAAAPVAAATAAFGMGPTSVPEGFLPSTLQTADNYGRMLVDVHLANGQQHNEQRYSGEGSQKQQRLVLQDDRREHCLASEIEMHEPYEACNGRSGSGGCDNGPNAAADAADPLHIDDDDEVHITADVTACGATAAGGTSTGFHSVRHVAHFAVLAKRTLDKLECGLAPAPRRTLPQQRGRTSADGMGGNGRAAAAAAATRPLADFAFMRCAPKRRSSAGRGGGSSGVQSTPTPAGLAAYRPSVFVQPTDATAADQLPPESGRTLSPHLAAAGAVAEGKHGPANTPACTAARHGVRYGDDRCDLVESGVQREDNAGGCSEDCDGSDDDVMIVQERGGPDGGSREAAGFSHRGRLGMMQPRGLDSGSGSRAGRQMRAVEMLRRPFQLPRSTIVAAATTTITPVAAERSRQGGRGGRSRSVVGLRSGGREGSYSQQRQQQRITDFSNFAFTISK